MSAPSGVIDVLERFPDEAACRQHVFDVLVTDGRWRCRACGHRRPAGPPDEHGAVTCAACHQAQPLTAGTGMEDSRWSLQTWIVAAHLMESQPVMTPLRLARMLKQQPSETIPWMRQVQKMLEDPHGRRLLGCTETT